MPFPRLTTTLIACCSLAPVSAYAQQQPPQTPPAAKPSSTALPRSSVYDHPLLQKKVSLALKDADIDSAVKELAKVSGISLVVERSALLATRPVTLELKDAPLGNVLDAIGTAYGYRWRRKGEVFLLTMVPDSEGDDEELGEAAVRQIYEQVLTPEQRALADKQGYIEGKDLTPGQKGILSGFLQEMMRRALSGQMGNQLEVGRVEIDMKNHKFGITGGSGGGK